MKTVNEIVRNVATEMLNTSMQDITAEVINGWATRLGDAVTCEDSSQVGNESLTPNEMEMTNDILCEMREFADVDSQTIGRDVLRRRIQRYCDRIEAAHKLETVTDCNALQDTSKQSLQGNTAKMREALEEVRNIARAWLGTDDNIPPARTMGTMLVVANTALAEPPRNCDLYEKEDDAFRAHRYALEDYPEETSIYYEEWLFHKAKGENK